LRHHIFCQRGTAAREVGLATDDYELPLGGTEELLKVRAGVGVTK
jgi:hypothetical protein